MTIQNSNNNKMKQQHKHKKESIVYVIDFSKVSTNPLNPLNKTIREYIVKELQYAIHNPTITSIILTGGFHGNFSSGADISEFSNINSIISTNNNNNNMTLIDIVNMIEKSTKPIIAAINGICLGGGCELILGCHYRIGSATTIQIGLPEVHVGVIPGAGGTQRLSKLIGLSSSIQMIISGKPITNSNKALQMNLLDAIVDKNNQTLYDLAYQWALYAEVIDPTLSSRRLCNRSMNETPPIIHGIMHATSLAIPTRNNGGDGMHNALHAIKAACTNSFDDGMEIEKELFIQTLLSEQGQARRYSFFATRNVQKVKFPNSMKSVQDHILLKHNTPSNKKKTITTKDDNMISPITEVGVIGAGTMGVGIAIVFLLAGYNVHLVDINENVLKKGIDMIHQTLKSYVIKKRMSLEQCRYILTKLLNGTTQLNDLYNCSIIVEAIIENMKIKQDLFYQLDTSIVTNYNCIFVTNTSTLDINIMSSTISKHRQQLFAGFHFFSPAHIMKLIEIVKGQYTSNTTITILQLLCKTKLSKIAVVVGNCDGFVGNRMLKSYTYEMVSLLIENVATIQSIDYTIQHIHGFPIGPFAMSDIAGNDIGYNIRLARGWARRNINEIVPKNRPERYSELPDDMVSKLNRLGQKVSKGWYDYNPTIQKGRKGLHSIEMESFIEPYKLNNTKGAVPFTSLQIIERLLYPLVNEGFKILEENIVSTPEEIDIIWIYGYGWPAYKGGPMYWANHIIGLNTLLNKLNEFHIEFPNTEHYIPSTLLIHCVNHNITLDEYYNQKKNNNNKSFSKL